LILRPISDSIAAGLNEGAGMVTNEIANSWGWRLHCKHDLLVFDRGGETNLAECFAAASTC
jgi:hypothetical protein